MPPPAVNGISTKTLPPPIERLILNETLPSLEIRRQYEDFLLAERCDDECTDLFVRLLRRNESPVTLMHEALASFAFPFVDIMSIRNGTRLDPNIIRDRFASNSLQVLLWVSLPWFSDEKNEVYSVLMRPSDGAEAAEFDQLMWSEGRWQIGYSEFHPFPHERFVRPESVPR